MDDQFSLNNEFRTSIKLILNTIMMSELREKELMHLLISVMKRSNKPIQDM
jgi:hypothetical protein